MRQLFQSILSKNVFFLLLLSSIYAPSVIFAQAACESTAIHQKTWAMELTESGQGISFINRSAAANAVTVKVYNPDGTVNMTRTVSLAAYQTVTQYPGVATGSGGWGLPITVQGTPTTDLAYGMVATSSEAFSAMLYPDEMESGFGTGKTAIWAQNTVNDTWFGMYNYPAIASNGNAREYFFVTNPSSSAATISVNLYKSNGTALGTNPRVLTVGATRTVKVYLEDDLNSSPNNPAPPSPDVAGANQNISVHLTSDVRVNVQVYTSLGTDWLESGDYWQAHNGSAGVYVGYGTDCYKTKYGWIDQKNGAQQTAARVTNPHNFPITIRETWYPDDTIPRTYVLQTTIPAHGTAELPRAESTWKDEPVGQTPNGKGRHYRVVESVDSDGAGAVQVGGFHVHVSYDQQIDYPAPLLTSYWWGSFSSGATDELFFINPHDTAISINVEYSVDGSGILMPATAQGSPIIVPAKEAMEWQISSDFLTPRTEPPLPSGDRTKNNITYHYYSSAPFFLHLELTFPGPYGDLMPWDCGCGAATEDWGDLPDTSGTAGIGNYPTLVEHNGPSHSISANLRLGTLIDGESDGNPSVSANNDDANNSDDEDGVDVNDLKLVCGQTASVDISVYNNSGSTTYLYGWIDLDGDGSLETSERRTLTIPTSATAQSVTLNFGTVPCSALTTTFARFRLGTDNVKSSVPTGWGGSGEVEDYLVTICTKPSAITFTQTAPTCTGATANNNGKITLTGATNADKYGISTGTTYSGVAYSAATSVGTLPTDVQSAIPNTGGSYTLRLFNGSNDCYKDTTISVTPVTCSAPCNITATFTQGNCNNNGTTAIDTDDYFTIAVSAVSATNGGSSGKYEVLLNGIVLNIGGTAYGTSVTVGTPTTFKADGTTTYQLKVRDLDITTCETSVFTTTVRAACSTIPCPPQICVPVTVTRN